MADAAPINPTMLRWARSSAGYTVEDVAERLNVKPALVAKWEAGEAEVTYGRVDLLSALYRRPSAIFYLEAPPNEDAGFPPDFRADAPARTPGIILQVRRAKERRELAIELSSEMGEAPISFGFKCTQAEDPEDAGARLRTFLSIDEPPDGWRGDTSGYDALGARKSAVEAAGVLVFQGPEDEIGDASGFSMHFDLLPLVVLRASDVPRRRSFTLMHEMTHVGLREGGLCDLHDGGVELFCNRVSAASLMPPRATNGLNPRSSC